MKIAKNTLRKLIREFIEDLDLDKIDLDLSMPKEEPKVMGHGGSAKMSKSQLFHIAKNSQSLHDKLLDDDQLPNWVQAKITLAKYMIDSAHDHLDYKLHRSDNE